MHNILRFVVLSAACIAVPAFGELAAIHETALPQQTAVLAAYEDALKLEPYSEAWTANWQYPIPKEEVANRLAKVLALLSTAAKEHPENAELLLLTGLVAHYAYNVDVHGSYDQTMQVLGEAVRVAPSDVRGPWFRAAFVCSTEKPGPGAKEFLAIEQGKPWDQLPIGFWDDYMVCAQVMNMPAHVLRAADHLNKLHAPDSEMAKFLREIAAKRFNQVDLAKEYEPKEAWFSAKYGEDWTFSNSGCGLQVTVHGDWQIQQLALSKGACTALFGTGPYKAKSGKLSPSILVLVQRSKENQYLEDYLNQVAKPEKFKMEPEPIITCPMQGCLVRKILREGSYGKNGDREGRVLVFERDEPDFPGLLFETPNPPPTQAAQAGAQYFRPDQVLKRIPGKLYYAVILDVASSIEEPGLKDFQFLLQNLKVE